MKAAPIGIFDSGVGGLSVWKSIRSSLPNESMIYFADQANCPYGPQPEAKIQQYAFEICQYFEQLGCKLIVIACNTATAAAIRPLRNHFSLPFVGLEPAVKPASEQTQSGVVGILATEGTFRGRHFLETREKFASKIELIMQVGHGLVTQVESGDLLGPQTMTLLESYLYPMLEQGADQIVLGCTHYPFLTAAMESIVKDKAKILNPAPAVAKQVQRLLEAQNLLRIDKNPRHQFITSGEPADLQNLLTVLLNNRDFRPTIRKYARK